jgi:SAM-dependent methyltransferase
MALASLDLLRNALICPACGSALEGDSPWRCSNDECAYHDAAFVEYNGKPVFIDSAKSIVDAQTLARADGVAANSAVRRSFKRFAIDAMSRLHGTNRVAERNARRITDLMRELPRRRLLVIGGASVGSGAEALYRNKGVDVIGFDIVPSQWTQFAADAHAIPLAASSVDAVWIQAVLEHVLDPQAVVAEIERVLRPNGLVYADTPFMQQVHLGPYDFTRFTESGHRWLFRNFECIDSGVVYGPGAQLAWSLDYAARAVTRSRKIGTAVHLAALPLAYVLDRCASPAHSVDGACAVYFLGRKTSAPLTPRDMVNYYKGAQRR